MALEPEKKTKTTKAKKAVTGKKTAVKKTVKKVAKKPTAKKPATKKAPVKKAPVGKTTKNSEDKTKKDTPMSTKENTQSSHHGIDEGLGNAKLEQTGNVADKIWRLMAMTAFAFIANFALFAIVVLSAMQFVVVFMEDKPNKEVQSLVKKLEGYLSETISFLAYKTDVMPFPFSSFPKNKN